MGFVLGLIVGAALGAYAYRWWVEFNKEPV